MTARDWSQALAKVRAAGRCLVCGSRGRVEAAHTVGREHDEVLLTGNRVVRADDVVALCRHCHLLYDARQLDLLPYLSNAEQAAAVGHVGIERARKRLTSGL